LRGFFHYKS